MSKEIQIRDGNLIASFDLENEDGDIDFCKLLKVSHGIAEEIGMFVDYVATNKIIGDQSKQIAELQKQLEEKEKEVETLKAKLETAEYWNKKYDDCQQQLALTEKALKLAREYMFNVMCADDVPFESWFIECAKNDWKSS